MLRILFAFVCALQVAACSVTPSSPIGWSGSGDETPGADASDTSGEGVGDASN